MCTHNSSTSVLARYFETSAAPDIEVMLSDAVPASAAALAAALLLAAAASAFFTFAFRFSSFDNTF